MHNELSALLLTIFTCNINVSYPIVVCDAIGYSKDTNGETKDDASFCYNPGSDGNRNKDMCRVNNDELRRLSEELFRMDNGNLYRHISINFQGHTTLRNLTDNAPKPLLTVASQALETPTTKLLQRLYDNYELNTQYEEHVTDQDDAEENELIEVILTMDVMVHAMDFLSSKGYFRKSCQEYRDILKKIWFRQYSRGKKIYGSSGFEHVFLAEYKRGYKNRLIGFHNWIFFRVEELANRLNYLGLVRSIDIPNRAAVAQMHFTYNGKHKASSMFIGTSPEFELALYTVCFFTRPNGYCRISLDGIKFGIQTYVWYDDNKRLVAAAFPVI